MLPLIMHYLNISHLFWISNQTYKSIILNMRWIKIDNSLNYILPDDNENKKKISSSPRFLKKRDSTGENYMNYIRNIALIENL